MALDVMHRNRFGRGSSKPLPHGQPVEALPPSHLPNELDLCFACHPAWIRFVHVDKPAHALRGVCLDRSVDAALSEMEVWTHWPRKLSEMRRMTSRLFNAPFPRDGCDDEANIQ